MHAEPACDPIYVLPDMLAKAPELSPTDVMSDAELIALPEFTPSSVKFIPDVIESPAPEPYNDISVLGVPINQADEYYDPTSPFSSIITVSVAAPVVI